jgi:hypothetical protein
MRAEDYEKSLGFDKYKELEYSARKREEEMGFIGIAGSLEFGGFLRRMIGTPYLAGTISLLLKMAR